MSRRHRIQRRGAHFSSRYRETETGTDQLQRTTLLEMANRMIADDAHATMEAFRGLNAASQQQDLYVFMMVEPRSLDDLAEAFAAAMAGIHARGMLPAGPGCAPFLPRKAAPTGNTGLTRNGPRPTAGERGDNIIILPERLGDNRAN